jgi:hypothetical protein
VWHDIFRTSTTGDDSINILVDIMRRSCKYFDYGDTAPTAYGAFCAKKKKGMTYVMCKKCKDYKYKRKS